MVEAHFDNIKQVIADELRAAKYSVYVAVAWLTDKDLFQILKQRSLSGVEVKLLILGDEINSNSGIDYNSLSSNNSCAYVIPLSETGNLMHHKFCVVDGKTVITGSYNWSYRARQNDENITITRDHAELASQFIVQFKNIVEKYFGKSQDNQETVTNYPRLIKRLAKLKLLIELEEIEELKAEIPKIAIHTKHIIGLAEMLNAITAKQYAYGLLLLEKIINKYQAIIVFEDPENFGLNLELKALELECSALADEKSEVEKIIREFSIKHNRILGAIMSDILFLKLKIAERKKQQSEVCRKNFEQAKTDYENYHKHYEQIKLEKLHDLTEEEKRELKAAFRKAALLCHPDKVDEELKSKAEEMFSQLKDAYDQNDLALVKEFLSKVESNQLFTEKIAVLSVKEKLRTRLQIQRDIVARLTTEVTNLKATDIYRTITSIADWDAYFEETLVRLKMELKKLTSESE